MIATHLTGFRAFGLSTMDPRTLSCSCLLEQGFGVQFALLLPSGTGFWGCFCLLEQGFGVQFVLLLPSGTGFWGCFCLLEQGFGVQFALLLPSGTGFWGCFCRLEQGFGVQFARLLTQKPEGIALDRENQERRPAMKPLTSPSSFLWPSVRPAQGLSLNPAR